MYTIQDLADGKCSVINDGTLQELRKVLNLAFPKDTCTIVGTGLYYFLNTNGNWIGTGLKHNLPAQSVRDFLVDDFVLPNTWCIKSNKNIIDTISKFWDDSLFLNNVYTSKSCIENYQDFYWYSRNLASGAPFGKDGGSNHVSKTKIDNNKIGDVIEITYEQFCKYVLKEEVKMNRRFPFYLNPDAAQKIVNIACSEWKNKLAAMWASNIVLNKQIEITEAFYKEMRKACTKEQHQLFDDIFGKDEPTYQYTDGELVWVKSGITRPWFLRYTTGKIAETGYLICYDEQRKSGTTTAWFGHQPAPGITLPD